MPRATCRCGQTLNIPRDGSDRIVCTRCGAKIRVRRPEPAYSSENDDGFIRFPCVCGRRLKVASADNQGTAEAQCRCPDCGRVLNVPRVSAVTDPETPTTEMSTVEMGILEAWTNKFGLPAGTPTKSPSTVDLPAPWRAEAGMRVCPQCGKPIHLGAEECSACGVAVPRR